MFKHVRSITRVALSHSAQGHGKQHYLSGHRPSATGHTRKWRRLSLPSWLDRWHRPPRAGLHTCLRPLCAGPRHRSHDSNGQRQRTQLTLPRPNTRHAHRLAVGSAAAGVRAAEVCGRQNARQAAVRNQGSHEDAVERTIDQDFALPADSRQPRARVSIQVPARQLLSAHCKQGRANADSRKRRFVAE